MNGLQFLVKNDSIVSHVGTFVKGNQGNTADRKGFYNILAAVENQSKEYSKESSETIHIIAEAIGEYLHLDEIDLKKVEDFLHVLFDGEQIVDLTDTNFIEQLVLSIYELLQISPEDFNTNFSQVIDHLIQLTNDQELNEETKTSVQNFTKYFNGNLRQVKDSSESSFDKQKGLHINQELQLEKTKIKVAEQRELHRLFQQFQTLLQKVHSEEELSLRAPKILKLVKQLYSFNHGLQNIDPIPNVDVETKTLLQELVNRYTMRMNFTKQATYNNESQVTSQDMMKWIKHLSPTLLTKQVYGPETQTIAPNILKAQTISPIEQYMLYVQRPDNEQLMRDQLVKQMRQVFQTSSFLPNQSLTNQLLLTLKPDHLGEMFLRFMEVNGEMTVKIFVTSLATKAALEANIHQLKHMFAPHQVSIERVADGQVVEAKDDSLLEDEDAQKSHQESEQDQQNTSSDERGTVDFQKLLNEIV